MRIADKIAKYRTRLNEDGFKLSLSTADEDFVREFYTQITGKKLKRTRCNDCLKDALMEMVHKYNSKTTTTKMEKLYFKLRAGAIIRTQGIGVMSFKNITNKLAIEHWIATAEKGEQALKYFYGKFQEFPGEAKQAELLEAYYSDAPSTEADELEEIEGLSGTTDPSKTDDLGDQNGGLQEKQAIPLVEDKKSDDGEKNQVFPPILPDSESSVIGDVDKAKATEEDFPDGMPMAPTENEAKKGKRSAK